MILLDILIFAGVAALIVLVFAVGLVVIIDKVVK